MATEKELELLDNYLANRLNTNEKAEFEKKLEADPNLRTELEFQQRLIQGIRNARATELKSMLKNIPLSAIEETETSWVPKVITGGIIAGLLGTGLYFVLNQEKEEKHETLTVTEKKVIQPKETIDEPELKNTPVPVPQESRSLKVEKPTTSKITKKSDSSKSATEGTVTEKRKLEVFDPTHEMEATKGQNSSEIEEGSASTTSSIVVETDNTNKKYVFNYQFKDGKLLLYGAFERNLYEILEFFDDSKRTIFLYYKDSYYLLDEGNQKVKPLIPITDSVLLKKLKEHRGS